MLESYDDIRSKIAEQPQWWDENGVPRYCEFEPSRCANIYAREAVLFVVTCQGCGKAFHVAQSRDDMETHRLDGRTILTDIGNCDIHYGDPPNVACCPAGPTMSSEPRYVIGYWRKNKETAYAWRREPALDGKVIVPDWVEDKTTPLEDWDIPKVRA